VRGGGGLGFVFEEMQNGAIWDHFKISYIIESSTILMTLKDKNFLKLSKICMPVASATAEMPFSVLRRLKTYVRSAMKNDWLSSL
jgi:hypothetical protein